VGVDHCGLIVFYVVSYCCSWEHVKEHFENFKNPLNNQENLMENNENFLWTWWPHFRNSMIRENQNCFKMNFQIVPRNKSKLAQPKPKTRSSCQGDLSNKIWPSLETTRNLILKIFHWTLNWDMVGLCLGAKKKKSVANGFFENWALTCWALPPQEHHYLIYNYNSVSVRPSDDGFAFEWTGGTVQTVGQFRILIDRRNRAEQIVRPGRIKMRERKK
jgi:hypothetical protein